MTEKMIAYCGLTCTECPAYVATQANDMAALAKLAETWSKEFNASLKAKVACAMAAWGLAARSAIELAPGDAPL